jgi:hypothetical protein
VTVEGLSYSPVEVPKEMYCPITQEIMLNPVFAKDDFTYEEEAITTYFQTGKLPKPASPTCHHKPEHGLKLSETEPASEHTYLSPMTGEALKKPTVRVNRALKNMITTLLSQQPQLWEEVYFSQKQADEALLAITHKNTDALMRLLSQDRRLLLRPLREGKKLLEWVLGSKNVELLMQVCRYLNPIEWQRLINDKPIMGWLSQLIEHYDETCLHQFMEHVSHTGQAIPSAKEIALFAIEHNELGLLKFALQPGLDINAPVDEQNNTLLHVTAIHNRSKLANFLIDQGASISQRNKDGLKPAGLAQLRGNSETENVILLKKVGPLLARMGLMAISTQRWDELNAIECSIQGKTGNSLQK